MPNFSATLTNSANDPTCIFCCEPTGYGNFCLSWRRLYRPVRNAHSVPIPQPRDRGYPRKHSPRQAASQAARDVPPMFLET